MLIFSRVYLNAYDQKKVTRTILQEINFLIHADLV